MRVGLGWVEEVSAERFVDKGELREKKSVRRFGGDGKRF